jgi:hypothetical protein
MSHKCEATRVFAYLFIIFLIILSQVEGKTQSRKFSFDTVFDPNSVQDEVFNYSGIKRLINMAIDGFLLFFSYLFTLKPTFIFLTNPFFCS